MRCLSYRKYGSLSALALLSMFPALVVASKDLPDTPAHYRHLVPLTVSARQGIVQFPLTREVYSRSQSAQLADLRVFDADGRQQAFSLMLPTLQAATRRHTGPVSIFPVYDTGHTASALPRGLEIRTSHDGAVLSVSTKTSAAGSPPASALASLILDLTPPPSLGNGNNVLLEALTFTLPRGVVQYSAQVLLEVSADLKSWTAIDESDLDWLTNDDTKMLANDRLEFAAIPARYARLSWNEGMPIKFAEINATFRVDSALPQRFESLLIPAQSGRFDGDLLYATPMAIPVEKIGLQLTQPNVSVPVELGQYAERAKPTTARRDRSGLVLPHLSRPHLGRSHQGRSQHEPRTEWIIDFLPKLRTTFYQFSQDGLKRASGDVAITAMHTDHWVLRPATPLSERPALRVTWSPATLVFVASGRQPYTLAVGRAGVQSVQLPLARLAPGFTLPELASVERALAGPARNQTLVQPGSQPGVPAAPAGEPARGRIVVLWSVLLLGVVILGFMAWKLTGQLREDGSAGTSGT